MSLLSTFNANRAAAGHLSTMGRTPHVIEKEPRPRVRFPVDEQSEPLEPEAKAAPAEDLTERAVAATGILRRTLHEAEAIQRRMDERTQRLNKCLVETAEATRRLEERLGIERALRQELDQMLARTDRQVAQARARVNVFLDESEERLRALKREAEQALCPADDAARPDAHGQAGPRARIQPIVHSIQQQMADLAEQVGHLGNMLRQARDADASLARTIVLARKERKLMIELASDDAGEHRRAA